MPITRDCMVANLQIGTWQGFKLDKGTAQRMADLQVRADTARVHKLLVPKAALADLVSDSTAIRTHFYEHTLPWKDNGDRLLTKRSYPGFLKHHEELRERFNWDADHFVDVVYPREVARAEFELRERYNPDDYPSQSELRRRFYVHLDIDAVTASYDFRVELEEADEIRAAMDHQLEQRIARAAGDVWQRLYDTLSHYADKMEGENIFRDTTVTNLQRLVELVPDLNVLEDANLERTRKVIADEIAIYSPQQLRKEPAMREAARERALEVLDVMRGFMVSFGSGVTAKAA